MISKTTVQQSQSGSGKLRQRHNGRCCDADDDNDGLPDGNESDIGTDPNNPDTDSDGINDGDEVNDGTNPLIT